MAETNWWPSLMKNLTTFYNNNIIDTNENSYLSFVLGNSRYAIAIQQVVEIMKLPNLDYPQRLANNFIGLLNYNNLTINVLDLRFYLSIKVTPYSTSNQLLIVKTDETILGLLIDKVEDIISIDQSNIEYFTNAGEEKIIEFLYQEDSGSISVINLNVIEELLKKGVPSLDIDIPSLFPKDEESKNKLIQRGQALKEKFNFNLITDAFSQDKFISFSIENENYCINLECVKEFLKNVTITPVPCSLDYISGVIGLRGDFITVVDLKRFLEITPDSQNIKSSENSVIILELPDFKIGFLVDNIFSIISIPEELIQKNSPQNKKYVLNEILMEENLYTILDIKSILSDEKFYIEET